MSFLKAVNPWPGWLSITQSVLKTLRHELESWLSHSLDKSLNLREHQFPHLTKWRQLCMFYIEVMKVKQGYVPKGPSICQTHSTHSKNVIWMSKWIHKMELINCEVNHLLSLEMVTIWLFPNRQRTYIQNHRIVESSVRVLAGYLIFYPVIRKPRNPFQSMHFATT